MVPEKQSTMASDGLMAVRQGKIIDVFPKL
jgi:hypothetical protein